MFWNSKSIECCCHVRFITYDLWGERKSGVVIKAQGALKKSVLPESFAQMDLAGSNENFRCDFISKNCFFLLLREIYLSLFTHTADLSHIGGSFLFICSICESPEAIISEVCRCFHSFLCCLKQSVNFVKMPSSVFFIVCILQFHFHVLFLFSSPQFCKSSWWIISSSYSKVFDHEIEVINNDIVHLRFSCENSIQLVSPMSESNSSF